VRHEVVAGNSYLDSLEHDVSLDVSREHARHASRRQVQSGLNEFRGPLVDEVRDLGR
jgi:hypothetical protein